MSNIDAWQAKSVIANLSQTPENSFFVAPSEEDKKNDDIAATTLATTPSNELLASPKIKSKRCITCNKKLSLATEFLCKCAGLFCTNHRFPDSHNCTFDHKEQWKKSLSEKNPQIIAEKISKI